MKLALMYHAVSLSQKYRQNCKGPSDQKIDVSRTGFRIFYIDLVAIAPSKAWKLSLELKHQKKSWTREFLWDWETDTSQWSNSHYEYGPKHSQPRPACTAPLHGGSKSSDTSDSVPGTRTVQCATHTPRLRRRDCTWPSWRECTELNVQEDCMSFLMSSIRLTIITCRVHYLVWVLQFASISGAQRGWYPNWLVPDKVNLALHGTSPFLGLTPWRFWQQNAISHFHHKNYSAILLQADTTINILQIHPGQIIQLIVEHSKPNTCLVAVDDHVHFTRKKKGWGIDGKEWGMEGKGWGMEGKGRGR